MRVTIRDGGDLAAISKDIRKALNAKQLRKELTKGIREELRPAVLAVKSAYGGGKHLRPALRKATRMEVRTGGKMAGASIRVDGRKMPADMRSVPKYYEGYKRPWRAPVFGNRDVWVTHRAHPTFDKTVKPFEARVGRRIDELAQRIVAKIAKE